MNEWDKQGISRRAYYYQKSAKRSATAPSATDEVQLVQSKCHACHESVGMLVCICSACISSGQTHDKIGLDVKRCTPKTLAFVKPLTRAIYERWAKINKASFEPNWYANGYSQR